MCPFRVALVVTILIALCYAKSSPAEFLKSVSDHDRFVDYDDHESHIVSWTGEKISSSSSSSKKSSNNRKISVKKNKSGLTIERNFPTGLASDDGSGIQELLHHQPPPLASTYLASSSSTSTSASSSSSSSSNGSSSGRKRNQRKRGRGQRQKMNKNALRLLSGQTETVEGGGAFPPLFNVAPRASITVNATCGQNGREEFCKLVDAYPHKNWSTQCGICNAQSSDPAKQHPIEAILNNGNIDERWWQSPTLQYGRHFEYVTITMDLKQVYEVFFVMLKSANSPRPASWILEKSLDDINYQPWQYFGLSDADCRRRYGVAGQNGKYVFTNDTEVICTTQFSKALPLENGELHVSLLKNRPGAMEQSAELMDFIAARYIRIRLQGMHSTANLDNSVDWLLDAQSLEKRSFYSLKQIRLSARLSCHGHAEKTIEVASGEDPKETSFECVCMHNTCGSDCGSCCPLFQDKPFRNGTTQKENICEICQCNGHATICEYDEFLGRGVCQDCRNNTAGNECEFCRAGHFRPKDASLDTPCEECQCHEVGSVGCHAVGGGCICKDGFLGDLCAECAPGYHGENCTRCSCDSRGSLPGAECEDRCICKINVEGDSCTECKLGYFGLSAENPHGCLKCYCSGVGFSCSSANMQTLSFETLNDWKITDISRSQVFYPNIDVETGNLVYGMYDMTEVDTIYWMAPVGYTGNKLTSYGSRISLHVSWVFIRGDTSGHPTSCPNVILFGRNGLQIAFEDREYTSDTVVMDVILKEDGWYHLQNVPGHYRGMAVTRNEFMSVLVDVESVLIRGFFHTDQVETILERATIYTGGTELGAKSTTFIEECICPPGYTGFSCENCEFGYIRVDEGGNSTSKCIPCPCNGHSNSCDLQIGNCGECMHNTFGERCERCKVGFYGNPMHGTPNDCKRCACPLVVDSNNFSPSCQLKKLSLDLNHFDDSEYVCTQCPSGYTGDHCEMCDDGYYGNPTEVGSQCLPCPCDGGPCDIFTGKCITCSGNTEGWHCERCKMGYWGDPAVGCESCDCYAEGSDSDVCDSVNGQCLCKPRFGGQKCDECEVGFADVDLMCPPCECDLNGSHNDVCDPFSGQCSCKIGVTGLKCDECADEYFGLEEDGCEATEMQSDSPGQHQSPSQMHQMQRRKFRRRFQPSSTTRNEPTTSAQQQSPHHLRHQQQQHQHQQRFKGGKRRRIHPFNATGGTQRPPLTTQQQQQQTLIPKININNNYNYNNNKTNTNIYSSSSSSSSGTSNNNFNSNFHFNYKNENNTREQSTSALNEQTTTLRIMTSFSNSGSGGSGGGVGGGGGPIAGGGSSSTDHYLNSSHTIHSDKDHLVIRENTDIVVYQKFHHHHGGVGVMNGGGTASVIPCPPGARIVPQYIAAAARPRGRECFCNPVGAITLICEKRSGQCPCLSNVTGRRCDKCRPGHWNLTAGNGCFDCRCDPIGSRSNECNPWTGQCDCKIGISGQRCDQCQEGFYGFNSDGCIRCDPCPVEGQVCDTFNGRCICPPNSRGLRCSQCVPGTWGWQNRVGCINCDCDMIGSIGQMCDEVSGQCVCREGYAGRKCETCAVGYFGYPECRRCNCDVHGSFVRPDGLIACDTNGQCPCKALVIGLKCDTCRQGTFGLSNLNPEGCTRCFCFGRSDQCAQSEWSWGHIRMPGSRNLSIQYMHPSSVPNSEFEYIVIIQMEGSKSYREDAELSLMNNLNLIPKSTGNISIGAYTTFYYPLYFQLPPQFYGDRTSSYGGNLVYTLLTEGGGNLLDRKILLQFPLVQIHSHSRLIIDFYEYEERIYTNNDTFSVPLHESYWKFHQNGHDVDRSTMMAALQNIKHIFLRGTTTMDFVQVIIQNVHMDTAIYVYGSTNMIAKGVERCKCPKMYEGLSCQDPGAGYYRWKNTTEIHSTFIEDLIGRAAPCHCNGRSTECDRESGVCLNCRGNTGGDHCDRCAEGFYGDPNIGSCRSCPCPETSRNFAKGCTVWNGEVSCICRPGYTGALCDHCRPGFFGSPRSINGTCRSCDCNLDGIALDECNSETGQCHCKPGVTGRKCDVCVAERHFLEDRRCKLCDNCTLVLLDYVELISHKLRRGMAHMDLTGIPAPWLKLDEYEENGLDVTDQLQDYMDAKRMMLNYDDNTLQKLGSYAENNKFQSRKAAATAAKRTEAVTILRKESSDLFSDIGNVRSNIINTIFTLNNYGTEDHHMSLPAVLQEARYYLHQIQQHDETVQNTRGTWSKAWDLFYLYGNASDAAFDLKGRLEMFMRDMNNTNYRLSDARMFTDKTFEILNEIDDIHEHIVNLKSYLVEDHGQIRELQNEFDQYENNSLVAETDTYLDMIEGRQEQLDGEIDTIERLSRYMNDTLEENDKIRKEVYKHWLPKAQKHAARLTERSNEYMRQFQPTKNGARIALLASSAHKNISDAITAARRSSLEAKEGVSEAQNQLYPNDGSSVIERAKISLGKSKLLQKDALREMEKANVLKMKIKIHEDQVEGIKSRIIDAGIRTNNISSMLTSLNTGASKKMALDSIEMAARVSEQMNAENRKALDVNDDILRLREKFNMLEPDFAIKLGMAEENISLTKTNIRLANISLNFVEEQTTRAHQKFEVWNDTMSKQMQELRDKIAKARHAAEGIKVSVESMDPKCVRSYLPSSYGLSTSNSIKLSFALNNANGNSPLIYIQGRDGRYIAMDMYKRRVRLKWNLGGSTETITHPLEIQTRDPHYDDAWYHVEANRTLNIGSLQVRRMTNVGTLASSIPVTGVTDLEYTRFFRTSADKIWIGGYPAEAQIRDPLVGEGLNVILHQVQVDNKPLGLWNFAHSEGKCGGAMSGAQESAAMSNARYFNGLGYAEVKKSRPRPYRKNLFALQMTFRTLDENALLFLAVDDKNNRSVSVTLSRGRILFRIDYGDESKLEINTTKKYNSGKWIKIEAAREFVPKRGTENGSLRVNNDTPITGSPTVPIKSHMLPDLSKAVYYLGGVPPGFKSGSTKAPGADNPFMGCMMDVQINGETYDPLGSSTYFGVEQSCKDTVTKAGYTGNGFVELSSQSLRKRSNTGFVFRTLQPNALLLLSAYPPEVSGDYDSKDIKGNYSISVFDGLIHVWIDSGRSNIKLVSNSSVNDGEYHVVNLIKNGRKFDLMVDDELQDSKTLTGSPTMVSMPREAGGLYVGGAPEHAEYKQLAPTLIPLEGAIRDIVFNNKTVNFNQALSFSNVQIGRNGPQMGSFNGMYDVLMKTEPIGKSFTTAPEGCQRVGSYSYEPNAFKFGDNHHSYSQLNLQARNFWQRNFHIDFDFRSFYPNGLIFLAPGTKEKQKHYVSLLLKDGHLLLIVRGRRREELQLTAKLNNGEWHHVIINCQDRKVTMSVEIGTTDQKTSAQMKVPKKISASSSIYVGGLPEQPVNVPNELALKLEGFKGCLRKMNINGTTQDLARPGKHLNVGQCFPKVEKGSYFPGDAYAIYKKNFHVGKYLELELEFRTSELNGILLSVSEPNGFPALSLEIHTGNVILSCDLGDGNPFRVQSILPSKYAICDNNWHNISALYDFEQIALRIDNHPAIISLAQHRVSGKVQTKSALYIGGVPDIAPSGTLLTRENFKGCIRNVSIRNERRDWIDMDGLHNVLLSECLVVN